MSEPAMGRPVASAHYDAAYFEWQQECGRLGAGDLHFKPIDTIAGACGGFANRF